MKTMFNDVSGCDGEKSSGWGNSFERQQGNLLYVALNKSDNECTLNLISSMSKILM